MRSALVVLFNIDYSVNIPKLRYIYEKRFHRIYYVAPDHYSKLDSAYRDHQTNVFFPYLLDRLISAARRATLHVNENEIDSAQRRQTADKLFRAVGHKFYFYHFIAQIQKRLDLEGIDWVWFIGDDVLLNDWFKDSTVASRLRIKSDTDCVMCRPKAMSDEWIARFEGSSTKFELALLACIPNSKYSRFQKRKEAILGCDHDRMIMGGCSDFFGVTPALLSKLIPIWKNMFRKKMFVELAIPHSLLSMSERPIVTDDYLWSFEDERNHPETMIRILRQHSQWLFAHPVKLFNVEPESLIELTQ